MAENTVLSVEQRIWLASHLGDELFTDDGSGAALKSPKGIDPNVVLAELRKLKELIQKKSAELAQKQKELEDRKAKGEPEDDLQQLANDCSDLNKDIKDLGGKISELSPKLEAIGMPLETVADKSAEYEKKAEKRNQKLEEMRNLIAIQKQEFDERTDVTYQVENKVLPGTKDVKAKLRKGDRVGITKEKYDSNEYREMSKEHYKGRIRPLDPAVEKMLNLCIEQLMLISEQLRADEELDLTPNEIMNEIWTPLVREGIVSSDQCPDQYSRIMTLWSGANDLYMQRCEEKAREPVDKTGELQNMLDELDDVLGIGADVAGFVLQFVGGESAQEILKLARKCVHGGLQGTKKLVALDFDKAGEEVGKILEAAIAGATGNKELAKLVKGAFTATLNGALMSKALANRDWESAFGYLLSGVEGGCVCIDKGGDGKATSVSNHVINAMKGAKGIGKIAYLLTADPINTKEVMKTMGEIAKDGVSYGVKTFVLDKEKEAKKDEIKSNYPKGEKETDDDYNKRLAELTKDAYEAIDKQYEKKGEAVDGIAETATSGKDNDGALSIFADVLGLKDVEVNEEQVMMDVLRRTEAQALEEYKKKEETFERRIAIAFGVGVGADDEQMEMIEGLYDIDVLIGEIEEANAKIQLFKTLLDAVSGVLTLLLPQLGGPLKARNFAFDCAAAVRRGQELVKFKALVGDAKKSTSPQVHTLIAQVGELSRQLTNDVIEGVFHLVEACVTTAAGACEVSGIAAPAGEALKIAEVGIEAMHNAKNYLEKKFKEGKVKRGWNQFRKAVENPKDRRAIMKAFRKNPTLAKYGIAYGALEMGDPIAKETLRQCGLNDMTLANENTNAERVVNYLEAKFPDDIQIDGVLSRFAPDAGDPLSVQVWVSNKTLAKEAGWKEEKTSRIDVAMSNATSISKRIDKEKITIGVATLEQLNEHWDKLRLVFQELELALRAYQPVLESGESFARMVRYLTELADAAKKREMELYQEIEDRKKAIEVENAGKDKLQKSGEEFQKSLGILKKELNELMPGDDDPTGELTALRINDYLEKLNGRKLRDNIKSQAKSSVLLQPQVDLLEKIVQLAIAKTKFDPVQVAGHIQETIKRIEQCEIKLKEMLPAREDKAPAKSE